MSPPDATPVFEGFLYPIRSTPRRQSSATAYRTRRRAHRFVGRNLRLAETSNSPVHLEHKGRHRGFFIATHSTDILDGLMAGGLNKIRLIRIRRDGDVNHIKELSREKTASISNDPLTRYSGVFSGIFFQRVIIAEADSPRDAGASVGTTANVADAWVIEEGSVAHHSSSRANLRRDTVKGLASNDCMGARKDRRDQSGRHLVIAPSSPLRARQRTIRDHPRGRCGT